MIDISIFTNFYFTKYLFMAGAMLGLFKCIKLLILDRKR